MDEFLASLEQLAEVIDDCIATVYNVANVVYLYVAVSVVIAVIALSFLGSIMRKQRHMEERIESLYIMLACKEGGKNECISDKCDKRD